MRRKHPLSVLQQTAPVLLRQEKTPPPEDAPRCGQGHRHDHLRRLCGWPPASFRLFKQSQVRFHPDTKTITDPGYMGLQKPHGHTIMPKKRSQKYLLNKEDK